jgi:starvation-inducible outer membrane lipoprotein
MIRNFKSLHLFARAAVIAWIAVSGFMLTGCKTTESDLANQSERPWNSPRGWDGRLPAQMMEGR